MGISGLLPMVKRILKRKHIGRYAGSRIAIDGHGWIHKILPMIAVELYHNRPTTKHLDLFMSKVHALTAYDIVPVFVFDGDSLPSKQKTYEDRRKQREKARMEVEQALKRNDQERAREHMKRCVSVTPDILQGFLRVLRANGIEFIISPYEADAQLCFLQRTGYVDHIITEDSDLIIYGATNLLYKYDGAHVEEYDAAELHLCRDKFFQENILDISILSGCDYLDSIKGVGLVTAHEKLKTLGSIEQFIMYMISTNKAVPMNYILDFCKAKATFLHHVVYDPSTERRQFLSDPAEAFDFLGTLENTKFKTTMASVDRHFMPASQSKSGGSSDKENESDESMSFVMDSAILLSNQNE